MPSSQLLALTDAILFTGEAFVESHALLLEGPVVRDILPLHRLPGGTRLAACPDLILAPGFVDAQVNGGGGVLLNADPTVAGLQAVAEAHGRCGTTRFLPTCISDSPEVMARFREAVRAARPDNPALLGMHFEGPHLAPPRRGVHEAAHLRDPDEACLALYAPEPGEVILLTVAPERMPPDTLRRLRAQGAIIALGHTAAPPAALRAALKAGATGFTHLFNGMGPLSARDPGPAGIALDDPDSWCSVVADGHHLAPEMLRLAIHAKPPGKVFFVSDAMPPAGSEVPSPFTLYGAPVRVGGGRCLDSEGRLAGSAATLADCVRIAITEAGIEPAEALRMASAIPAAFLGVDRRFGKLLPGYAADIVALSATFHPRAVWREGERLPARCPPVVPSTG